MLASVPAVLASIPSPSESVIEIGPLRLTAYGLMIALGVVAAYELSRHRWARRGGDPEDIGAIAIWAVPAGLVGARIYHVITDWNELYADDPGRALRIWDGGLGIPGGIVAGVAVGVVVARRRGINLPVGLDMVAPALPLAQAIGRLGNWWNQELYGGPTDLPWGLEIDCEHRVAGYECVGGATDVLFHPTFLYEMLWNLALVGLLLLVDRRRVLRPGRLFVVYVGGYALGRLWVEAVRIDPATEIVGVRVNIWVSALVFLGAALFLVIGGVRRRAGDRDDPYVDGHRADQEGEPADTEAEGSGAEAAGSGAGSAGTEAEGSGTEP